MAISSSSLVLVVIIILCAGGFYLYKQGKIPWLKGVKMPRMFEGKTDDQVERLTKQTEKEKAKATDLKKVLEAKRGLAKARAENIKLRKEIDGVSEKTVGKAERDAQKAEQEAQKAKPRRL